MGGVGYDWTGSSFLAGIALQRAEAQLGRAEAKHAGIRSFLAEVESTAGTVFPTDVVAWRSPAATRYVERLHGVSLCIELMLSAVRDAEQSARQDVGIGQQHCEELGSQLAQAERSEQERTVAQAAAQASSGRGSWAEREQ